MPERRAVIRYAWLFGILLTASLSVTGYWIKGVSATQTAVVRHEAILPTIAEKLDEIHSEQKVTNHKVGEINERLSRIEGRR